MGSYTLVVEPMGVKFGMEEGTQGRLALRAMLPVIMTDLPPRAGSGEYCTLDSALRTPAAGIQFTQRPILRFFASQG